jgi:8-oxo-dGTP pyrophosphatase MutT (NUDIX family)
VKYADGYEGVTVAGLAIVRRDGGDMVFLARRAPDPTDAPDVAETWEFPGGHLDVGEDPFAGAAREFTEEVGFPLPEGEVTDGWRSEDGHYQGFVYEAAAFPAIADWRPTDEVQDVGWFDRAGLDALIEAGTLRPEVIKTDWSMIFGVSGNEDSMDEASEYAAIEVQPIPVHGVVAPEETATGDRRGFKAGAMTRRPLRLPLRDTSTDVGGHNGAFVAGSVDRLMRADGMVQFEGALMPGTAEDLIEKMEFFGGRYGVSVDGDQGSLDMERTEAENVMWFDQVRASGVTAVDIPAFHEAHVAFGFHPAMPEETLAASAYESGDLIGGRITFDRGPGWITNPRETKNIHDYWTKKGEEGYAKIGWGTPGDFRRAKALIGAKIAQHSPEKMRFLNQIIAQWHHDALGYWPGDLGKPGNAPDTAENRRRAAVHAALVEKVAETRDDIESVEDEAVEAEWEAVLVSSATGKRAYPLLSYFHRPETDDGAINLFEPDENGFRRVTGYAADWGVCHIGLSGQCVEPPRAYSDDYPGFHKGRTKTTEGYVYTGVLTYGVGHRDADTILSESADEAFFDNLKNAWAAVRVGEDDRGIWFSGVVLPTVPEEDLVAIEASGQVSGEWMYNEMRACLTVNVRGFEVERPSAAYDEDGNVIALAASAFNALSPTGGNCPEDPAERMEALRLIDAEVRFARLRMQFLAERGA